MLTLINIGTGQFGDRDEFLDDSLDLDDCDRLDDEDIEIRAGMIDDDMGLDDHGDYNMREANVSASSKVPIHSNGILPSSMTSVIPAFILTLPFEEETDHDRIR